MEEKKHPELEEGFGTDMCCESPVGNGVTATGHNNTAITRDDNGVAMTDNWDPGIGPYSIEELNARIDEAEICIDKAEKGDWSDWVAEEQSRANLYSKYPWLR